MRGEIRDVLAANDTLLVDALALAADLVSYFEEAVRGARIVGNHLPESRPDYLELLLEAHENITGALRLASAAKSQGIAIRSNV